MYFVSFATLFWYEFPCNGEKIRKWNKKVFGPLHATVTLGLLFFFFLCCCDQFINAEVKGGFWWHE